MAKGKGRESRQFYVVKANDLIRKTRYDLTTQQQKILLYAISKIQREDPPETRYEINIEELCDACGIEIDQTGGFYYQSIKRGLKTLHDNSMWVEMPDRSEELVSWIERATIEPLNGTAPTEKEQARPPHRSKAHFLCPRRRESGSCSVRKRKWTEILPSV